MCFINIECIYFKKEIPPIIQIFVIIDGYTMVFLWGIFCVVSRFIKALNNTKLCFNHAYHLIVKFKFVLLARECLRLPCVKGAVSEAD